MLRLLLAKGRKVATNKKEKRKIETHARTHKQTESTNERERLAIIR